MKGKRLAAVLSALVIVLSAAFAGCGNPNIYVDPAGNTYLAVTDTNGSTVVNDNGDIVVYQTEEDGSIVTDAAGEPQTQASVFPEQIIKGDTVDTPTYTLTLPSGWKAMGEGENRYKKSSVNAEASIRIVDDTYDNYYAKTQSMLDQISAGAQENGEEFTYEFSEFEYLAAQTTATRVRYSASSEEGDVTADFIFFMNNENLYVIDCKAPTEDFEAANFPELYSAIAYKAYKYYE